MTATWPWTATPSDHEYGLQCVAGLHKTTHDFTMGIRNYDKQNNISLIIVTSTSTEVGRIFERRRDV
jgi:hypothetical protein